MKVSCQGWGLSFSAPVLSTVHTAQGTGRAQHRYSTRIGNHVRLPSSPFLIGTSLVSSSLHRSEAQIFHAQLRYAYHHENALSHRASCPVFQPGHGWFKWSTTEIVTSLITTGPQRSEVSIQSTQSRKQKVAVSIGLHCCFICSSSLAQDSRARSYSSIAPETSSSFIRRGACSVPTQIFCSRLDSSDLSVLNFHL